MAVDSYRGVISQVDVLFAVSKKIIKADLDRFLKIARNVLGEDDPALDLSEEQRWAANIYGKNRKFSAMVRKGIAETLVLLAVYDENLFGQRLGFDGESEVAKVVRDLLFPVTTRKLMANQHDFPLYAEAAPNEFLTVIEQDLRTENPKIIEFLQPVFNVFFVPSLRVELLWALEGLA